MEMEDQRPCWTSPGRPLLITKEMSSSGIVLLSTIQLPCIKTRDLLSRASFVKDYNTFWTQVPAVALVRVGRLAGGVTPAYQAPTTYSRDQASYPYVPPTTTTSASTTTTRIVGTSPNPSTTQWSFAKPVCLFIAHPHWFFDPLNPIDLICSILDASANGVCSASICLHGLRWRQRMFWLAGRQLRPGRFLFGHGHIRRQGPALRIWIVGHQCAVQLVRGRRFFKRQPNGRR